MKIRKNEIYISLRKKERKKKRGKGRKKERKGVSEEIKTSEQCLNSKTTGKGKTMGGNNNKMQNIF